MDPYLTTILEKVLTHDVPGLGASRPKALYHYTSLETIQKVLQHDNVRLSHAEYSNDRHELLDAFNLIRAELGQQIQASGSASGFYSQVEAGLSARLLNSDTYVFCMCAGLPNLPYPQDMLSQWRAYAQDGQGGAISLDMERLSAIAYHLPGLRINPVIYDDAVKAAFVSAILAEGYARHQQQPTYPAANETIEALVFCGPLMKHSGFQEEREWRLIYVPRDSSPQPTIEFHPRRDLLAPYFDLKPWWSTPQPPGTQNPPVNVPRVQGHAF